MKANIIKRDERLSEQLGFKNLRYVLEMYHTYNGMNSKLVRKLFFSKSLLFPFLAIIFLLSACLINLQNKKPVLVLSKQLTAINMNKKFLSFMSAGHKRFITDLIWIQTLIESDSEHYKNKDLNSWLYLRFLTISELDPFFYQNYLYGGQFLSIIKDDLEGASVIFDKGLKFYPDDYDLNYNAGFLYYFEMGDYKKGLLNIEKIQFHSKAPTFFPSLVNKLKLETGSLDLKTIYHALYLQYQGTVDNALKLKLEKELYALKAEIDLKCLNAGKENCDRLDFDKQNYVIIGDKYHTQNKFMPYRLKKRGEHRSPLDSISTF